MELLQKREGAIRLHPSSTNNRVTGESSTNTNRRYKNYVPIDLMKAEIINFNNQQILNSELLNFAQLVNTDTSEIIVSYRKNGKQKKECRKSTYKNLVFEYYTESNRLTIKGSLHVFYNNGNHNYNDFDSNAFADVLKQLETLFGILPKHLHITQLEWGVNISPTIETNLIIDHCLFYKWKPFEAPYDYNEGKYYQVEYKKRYRIKLYNKALHYKIDRNILRVERKQIAYWFYCKQHGIGQTLQDLIDSDFKGLKETLLSAWNDILFFDPFINERHEQIIKMRDPKFWTNTIFNNRQTRKNYFDRLRKFNNEHGQNIHGQIFYLIEQKINSMNQRMFTFYHFSYMGKPSTFNNPLLTSTFNKYPILATHFLK